LVNVNFDLHKDAAPPAYVNADLGVPELPTVSSDFDMLKANLTGLLAKLSTLPLEKIGNEVVDAISDADDLLKDARPAVKGFDGLVSNANEQVKPLAQDASALLKEARARLELRPGEPLQSVNDTLADARK